MGTEALDGRYWYANLRQPVQFEQTTRVLIEQGCRALIEMGPHPVLAVAMTETAEASGADAVAVLGSLRREEGDWRRFVTCLAEAHVAGVGVDWAAVFAPWRPRRVELPTYAFQRQRYWLSGRSVGDVASVGLDGAGHALLGAVVAQPESGGVVLTGRLSLAAQPWLADHVVGGVVLFPGTGFVELAIRAGDEVGCGVIEELTLGAPLVVPDKDEVRIQVVVGGVGEFGGRPVSVYSRGGAADSGWVLHAEGRLGAGGVTGPAADLSVWPPAGAVSVDVSDGYERLAGRGYLYGRAFRGLRSLWRRGEELFAEVDVPEDARVGLGGFGLHPVVFDAALHAVALAVDDLEISVPFAWEQVSLHAAGAGAVRARIAPVRSGAMSVELADGAGGPVLSVGSLTMRPVTVGQLESAAAGGGGGASRLFEVKWVAAPVVDERPAAVSVLSWEGFRQSVIAPDASDVPDAVVFEVLEVPGGVVAGVYTAIHQVLAVVQSWLAQPVGGVLVVVTCGAVSLAGEAVADLAGAAVWGLVRSAQRESPGRIVLVDSDTDCGVGVDVARVLAVGEPQVLLRCGAVYVARLAQAVVAGVLRPPAGRAWRLGITGEGTVDNLVLEGWPVAEAPLAAGQVRVALRAVGVNFRDVLIALGMYPEAGASLGQEGAGVVVEVGPEVAGVAVGDAVMGLFPG
ncbi:polyketide synthase dehydratase domain-containing protein, partial [Mycobacterium szulgai]|uniref:polyketide synthase dehydratase domain-containing protein n=1 Tax=Mycobacterium szulgai TaxID=1787 RepID=UPI00111C574F